MEYMPGGELFTLLRKVGCFPEYVAVLYAAELVLAIEYLHNNNVIYRDLKLENIMMCAKGHLKLADLGIAKEGIGFGKKTYTFCGGFLTNFLFQNETYCSFPNPYSPYMEVK